MDGRLLTLGSLGVLALAGRQGSRSTTQRFHVQVDLETWDPYHEVAEMEAGDWTTVLDTSDQREAVVLARRLWQRALGEALALGPVLGNTRRGQRIWRVGVSVWDDWIDNPLDLPFHLAAVYPSREQAELLVERVLARQQGSASWLGFGRGRPKSGKHRMCETDGTSAAWVAPDGTLHELGREDHVTWAKRYLDATGQTSWDNGYTIFADSEVEAAVVESGSIASALTVQGWRSGAWAVPSAATPSGSWRTCPRSRRARPTISRWTPATPGSGSPESDETTGCPTTTWSRSRS